MIRKQKITLASAADESFADQRTDAFTGRLLGIYLSIGTLANTTDITITDDETGAPVLTIPNASASGWFAPQIPVYGTGGTAALFAAGGTAVLAPLPVDGELKVAAAQGGVSKTGDLWFFIEEGS